VLDGDADSLHPERVGHAWPRLLLLRGLGGIYLVAFWVLVRQLRPLIGAHGLTPAGLYLDRVARALGGPWEGFLRLPSLFWWSSADGVMLGAAWLGVLLALAVMAGVDHALVLALLWGLYLSFVHVGQLWLGYGWEYLLLESGFLAIFLGRLSALRSAGAAPAGTAVVVWLYRWLLFRLMFGAGLIKLRGDDCWRELTCLDWHYETQPNPHPLSWVWHHLPHPVHATGVVFNHLVELVVPFMFLAPRPVRAVGVVLLVVFQLFLIGSGNLAYFNWLTIVLAAAALDDRLVARFLRRPAPAPAGPRRTDTLRRSVAGLLAVLVGVLSIDPVANMLSPDQAMNTSFDRLHLVNTYGAFGSVDDTRVEVVIQGRQGDGPWRDYELPCKPGAIDRRPCLITPYHLRLDWQIWFVQFAPDIGRYPWLIHLAWQLLDGDPSIRRLLSFDPFDGQPPDTLRMELFEYHFTAPGEPGWWHRRLRGELLPPTRVDDAALLEYVRRQGWPMSPGAPEAP